MRKRRSIYAIAMSAAVSVPFGVQSFLILGTKDAEISSTRVVNGDMWNESKLTPSTSPRSMPSFVVGYAP